MKKIVFIGLMLAGAAFGGEGEPQNANEEIVWNKSVEKCIQYQKDKSIIWSNKAETGELQSACECHAERFVNAYRYLANKGAKIKPESYRPKGFNAYKLDSKCE